MRQLAIMSSGPLRDERPYLDRVALQVPPPVTD